MGRSATEGPSEPRYRGEEIPLDLIPARLRRGVRAEHPFWQACFEQALAYTLVHPTEARLFLIHGEVKGLFGPALDRTRHAWVELGRVSGVDGRVRDLIFDGQADRFYQAASYRSTMEALEEKRYTPFEAAAMHVTKRSPGPWDELGPDGQPVRSRS